MHGTGSERRRVRLAGFLAAVAGAPVALGQVITPPEPASPDWTPRTVEPHPRELDGGRISIVRFATFNLEDVRTEHLADAANERLKLLAEVIQRIAPDVVLLNEIMYDAPPRGRESEGGGRNARRFADAFLAVEHTGGVAPLRYDAVMLPSNTGVPSGFDLDNNGSVAADPGSRDYGGDCLGYGEHPGQYGMALLVRANLRIDRAGIRTFRSFKWKDMPGALLPPAPGREAPDADGAGWYSKEELAALPLSSKSHWDVPVELSNGVTIHVLCSHPTPPVFDGKEDRNGRRNHDEIRFWADYIDGAAYIIDDAGRRGGLAPDAPFVILGDLNADPEQGDSRDRAIDRLLRHARVDASVTPRSLCPVEKLRDEATSHFRLRVDYVLPSKGLTPLAAGVWRGFADTPPTRPGEGGGTASREPGEAIEKFPSDHFPVWMDVKSVAARP